MDGVHDSPLSASQVSSAQRTPGTPLARRSFIKNVAATAAVAQIGGFSSPGLEGVRSAMARHVAQGSVPGVVWLVSRGEETHADALGRMAYGGSEPLRRDAVFRIASASKPVTAVAAMILVEEGRLRLDDPVDELLPELAKPRVLRRLESPLDDTVPASRPISLRDLLTFRSGHGLILARPGTYPIQQAQEEAGVAAGPALPALAPDEWMKRLGGLPLIHQPGEKWLYHTGSDITGVLVARASRQSFGDFLRERIFVPLGMKDTGFHVSAASLDRLPVCYGSDPQTGERTVFDVAGKESRFSRPPVFEAGGGGLVSTVDDYHAFCRMMLDKGRFGGGRILSRASVELMTTNQITPEQQAGSILPESRGWGFGMSVVTKHAGPVEMPGRFGWDGGYGTSAYTDPGEGLIGVQFTQQLWTSPSAPAVQRDFWSAVYQAIAEQGQP